MIWIYIFGGIVVFLGFSAFFGAPYVPSRRQDLRSLFDSLYPLSEDDVVLDIGSGDGVVLREVSRRGVRAVGFEIHPLFVLISKWLSRRDTRVEVKWVNGWTEAFPEEVTLVYIFSVGRDSARLIRKVQSESNKLGRPLMLVCYGNPLPSVKPVRSHGAYSLYRFTPLHPPKA